MKKIYNSFDEIDRELKILKLQKDIDLEEVKLSYHGVKESLSPVTIVTNLFGSVVKKAFIKKVTNKLLGIKRVKKVDEAKL